VQTGATLTQEKRLRFKSQEFYLKTPEEMAQRFARIPEALHTTVEVAERCNVKLDFPGFVLPKYSAPEGYDANSYLRRVCEEALPRRYPGTPEHMKQRLNYELEVMAAKKVSDYILIVWDFMRFAEEHGIAAGIRGSAAGSVVLYLLGMTKLDPVALGLPFERFISPERGDMPDIDCDFEDERRDEVLHYVQQKYGPDRVAQIVTFNTMKARAAVRDVGRVMGIPLSDVDRVAKLIDPMHTIRDGLETNVELQRVYRQSDQMRQMLDAAKELEGLPRHASTHAAGLVIGNVPLSDIVPLQRPTGEGQLHTTQYDMDSIKQSGLVKIDLLGLRTLSVLKSSVGLVEQNKGVRVNLDALPYDDDKTFRLLSRGDTAGVFQLESAGMRSTLQELRPDRLEDIIAVVALYRPGPMAEIPNYISGKHGRRQITYQHPKLRPILEQTYGIIVYQEQVLEIAVRLAGFTMAQADDLRSAMKSKNEALMTKLKDEFLRGCAENRISDSTASQIYARMKEFAGYGFGKAHSACYAVLAYATAYLKAYYPVEFMAALLTSLVEKKDDMAAYVEECRRMGMPLLPPDVNESGVNFTVHGDVIRFGLAGIKHLSRPAIHAILEARTSGPFQDFFDFCSRVDPSAVNKAVMESLIRSGTLSSLSGNRAQYLKVLDTAMDSAQRQWKDRAAGQASLFGGPDAAVVASEQPQLPEVQEFPHDELLAMEKEYLGLFLSDHPLNRVGPQLERMTTARVAELAEREQEEDVIIGGIVTSCRRYTSRSGRPIMRMVVEDRSGAVDVTVFADVLDRDGQSLAKDIIVLVRGRPEAAYRAEEGQSARPRLLASALAPLEDREAVQALRSGKAFPRKKEEVRRTAEPHEAYESTPALHVRVPTAMADPGTLERLRQAFQTSPGSSPVFLHIQDNGTEHRLSLGPQYMVRDTPALRQAVQDLLGTGCVWMETNTEGGSH